MSENNKPMAPYVKLPELEEYKEWFKDFADLYREDGILQVTWKTNDGPMHHSGMSTVQSVSLQSPFS